MPIINIKMIAGRSQEQKKELVNVLTRETGRILEVEPESISIVIDEYSRDNWASAGKLFSDK
jgi:4-oxalocrotonate tautomerase